MKFLLLLLFVAVYAQSPPQQIHLALTGDVTSMQVTWMNTPDTKTSTVRYGVTANNLNMVITGTSTHYFWPIIYESPQINYATMTGLKPNTRYYYSVGDPQGGWSAVNSFTTNVGVFPIHVAAVGDIGDTSNSQMVINSILSTEKKYGAFNFLVHSGDLSYANGIQSVWDSWGQMIEPVSNHIPYMVAPGNHEEIGLFVPYNYRFKMPANSPNSDPAMYYSYDYSLIHFIVLNSEDLVFWQTLPQYNWLAADLASVNRAVTPWIMVKFHTPWYSSNDAHNGSGDSMLSSYEDIFYKYKVDLVLTGHVHAYERTLPVYNGVVTPDAPEYRTDGQGGNGEGLYNVWWGPPSWSAYRDGTHFGFSQFFVYNATHLHWQAIDAQTNNVLDDYWMIRKRSF